MRTRDRIAHDALALPAPVDPIIGRQRELDELAAALERGERLLSIVGAPGVGKTRLAEELAARFAANDGESVFCELAAARTSGDICRVVAAALDVVLPASLTTDQGSARLGKALATRGPLLLVVDNVEQLVDLGPATIGRWVKAAADLRVVATSRELLRLRGEWSLQLGPLPTGASKDRLGDAESLFIRRARAIRPSFELGAEDGELLAKLVSRLEGNPLAIELAAGRVASASLAELIEAIDRSLVSLESAHRDDDPRHHSLRRAVEWSWQLLGDDERQLLAQLSVFRSGFDRRAAEAIVQSHPDARVADLLDSLCGKSLIRTRTPEGENGPLRFHLYESVRELADEKLEELGDLPGTWRRHARYFLELGEQQRDAVESDSGPAALANLVREADNLIAAHHSFLGEGDAESALRVALCLTPVFEERGPLSAQLPLLESALAMAGGNSELSCRGLQAVAMAQLGLREYQAANASLERALAISCARSPVLQLLLRTSLAEVHRGKGNRERARRELDQSRETLTMVPRGVERTRYLRCRAIVARNFAQPDEASGYFEDALAEAAEGGQFRARGDILAALGHFYLVGGHGDPVPVFEEAVEIAEALGNSRQLGYLHGELGTAHLDQGNRESAGKHFERGLELSIRSGDEFVTGIAYGNLGALAHRQGHLDDAIDRYRQCLEQLGQTDAAFAEAFFTSLMAGALAERGDLTRARHQLDLARSIDVGPAFVDERNAVLGLQDGQLEVAEARRAQERGDPDAQAEHRSAVETILATPVPRTENTSLLQALLSQAYARLVADSASQWYIAADGREFRAPGMETVDISRRKLLRALLRALVERRLSDPDQPLSFEELAAAGWPGEAFDRVGGSKNRINVALVRLRKAGLEDLLARRPGGYLLDPDQPVTTEAR